MTRQAARRPTGRIRLCDRQDRISCESLRSAWTLWCWQNDEPPLLAPCTWCGTPTGNWCDGCTTPVANFLCMECEKEHHECRRCILGAMNQYGGEGPSYTKGLKIPGDADGWPFLDNQLLWTLVAVRQLYACSSENRRVLLITLPY